MGSFDTLLNSLHQDGTGKIQDAEINTPIKVNRFRQFEVPIEYNLSIAYEGDVNSQKITFEVPRSHEGHDLNSCGSKILRWKNTTNQVEDCSPLTVIDTNATRILVEWIVPPAAFVVAGNLNISITFYDKDTNGVLGFSWNTATFSGFRVEKTLSEVGKVPTNISPAQNEILYIDEENHNIVAPNGYNFVVAALGDRNTKTIYFQTKAEIGGIDIRNVNTKVSVIVDLSSQKDTYEISQDEIIPAFINSTETGSGLIIIPWKLPTNITCNTDGYVGTFSVVVVFENPKIDPTSKDAEEQRETQKVWKTIPFTRLALTNSLEDLNSEILTDDYKVVIDAQEGSDSLPKRKIGGTVALKRGSEEDWNNNNIPPVAGEPIVYTPDWNGYRMKIGDGIKTPGQLPFVVDPTVQNWARQEDPPTGVYMGSDEEEIPDTCDVWIDPNSEPTSKVDYLNVLDITDQSTIDNFMINMPQYTTRNVLFSGSDIYLGNTMIPLGSVGTITCGQNEAILNLTTRNRVVYTGYWGRYGWKLELVKAGSLENVQVSSINELESLVEDFNNQNKSYVLQFVNDIEICTGTSENNILIFDTIHSGTVGILVLNNYESGGYCKNLLNLTSPDYSTWTISTDNTKVSGVFGEGNNATSLYTKWNTNKGATTIKTHEIKTYKDLTDLPIKYGFYKTYGIATNVIYSETEKDDEGNPEAEDIIINFPAKGGIIELPCSWSQGIMICDGDITIFLYDYYNRPRVLYGNTAADRLEPSKWIWHGQQLSGTNLEVTPNKSK